jgi:hypothetical protein
MELDSSLRLLSTSKARKVSATFQRMFLVCFIAFLRLLSTQPAQCGQPQEAGAAVARNDSPQSTEPARRALPAPLDGNFPGSDYLGPTPLIGVPDTDPVYPLTKAVWSIAPALKDARIKVYGWVNPGISVSTSSKSNIPESYAIVPKRLELDQGVLRIERLPDTVQTDHVDWGFRLTPMMESTTAGLPRKGGSAVNF